MGNSNNKLHIHSKSTSMTLCLMTALTLSARRLLLNKILTPAKEHSFNRELQTCPASLEMARATLRLTFTEAPKPRNPRWFCREKPTTSERVPVTLTRPLVTTTSDEIQTAITEISQQ